jgi:hypothetical protein
MGLTLPSPTGAVGCWAECARWGDRRMGHGGKFGKRRNGSARLLGCDQGKGNMPTQGDLAQS